MEVYQRLLRDSSANLLTVLEKERIGFASLLHDSISHNLLLIKLGVQNVLKGENIRLNSDLEICLYRVAQEVLNNIIKHSKAKEFTLNLLIDDESIAMIISDNGIGFKPTLLMNRKYVSDGMGLMSMQERVERLNGSFHIDSSHNNGTVITVE